MKVNKNFLSFYYQDMTEIPMEIEKKKTALLIVDMQKEFILRDYGDSKYYKEKGDWERWIPYHDRLDDIVIPNTKKLIDYFRRNQMEVTYGRIACLKSDGSDRCLVQRSYGWNDILIPVNSFGAEMVDELAPLPDDIVVNKTTDSVPAGTNYTTLLRNMGIESVIVTGIVTDQCVASTVRSLADEGFKVICVEDCCAAPDMELHNMELKIMNVLYCNVLNLKETLEVLESSK